MYRKKYIKLLPIIIVVVGLTGLVAYQFFLNQKISNNKITEDFNVTRDENGDFSKKNEQNVINKISYLEFQKENKEWQIWIFDVESGEKEYSGHSFAFSENADNPHFSQSSDSKYACIVYGTDLDDEEVYFFDVEQKILKQISDFSFPVTKDHDGSDLGGCYWSIDSSKAAFDFTSSSHAVSESGQDYISIGNPPENLRNLLGRYFFDVKDQESKKWNGLDASAYTFLGYKSVSRSFSQGKRISIEHTLLNGSEEHKVRLIKHKGGLEIENPIYKAREHFPFRAGRVRVVNEPSPVALSPDHSKVAFIDQMHKIAIVSDGNLITYDDAEVHANFSRFYWISNTEIIFWQSRGGVFYNNDKGDWYKGDLMLLNTETSSVTNLTNSGEVLIQWY